MKKTLVQIFIIVVLGAVIFKACGGGNVYNKLRVQWLKVTVSTDAETTNKAIKATKKIMNKRNLSEKETYLTEMVYYTLLANQAMTERMVAEGATADSEKYKNYYVQIMAEIAAVTAVFTGDEYEMASVEDLEEIANSCKQFYDTIRME